MFNFMLSIKGTKKAGLWGAAVLACAFTLGSPAQATLMLSTGNPGDIGDNVIFEACDSGKISGPALTVKGCLNESHSTYVNFTGVNEDLVISGGQASIDGAVDGLLTSVTITLDDPNLTFSSLVFAIDLVNDGSVTFLAKDGDGTEFDFGSPLLVSGNGQKFFYMFSLDGQSAVSFTILSETENNIADLKQVRLGIPGVTDVRVTDVPEPGTLVLLGMGLLGLRIMTRRRMRVSR